MIVPHYNSCIPPLQSSFFTGAMDSFYGFCTLLYTGDTHFLLSTGCPMTALPPASSFHPAAAPSTATPHPRRPHLQQSSHGQKTASEGSAKPAPFRRRTPPSPSGQLLGGGMRQNRHCIVDPPDLSQIGEALAHIALSQVHPSSPAEKSFRQRFRSTAPGIPETCPWSVYCHMAKW